LKESSDDKLKKRAERFGLPTPPTATPAVKGNNTNNKNKNNQNNANNKNNRNNNAKPPAAPIDEEKLKKRMERFGAVSNIAKVHVQTEQQKLEVRFR
jgi:hypothetical protein